MTLRSSDLLTLSDLKLRVGIADSDTSQDTRLTDAIQAASDMMANYCNRRFDYDSAVVEILPAHGTLELILNRPPVWNIASIALDGGALDSTMFECLDNDKQQGVVTIISGALWTAGIDDGGVGRNRVVGHERRRYTATYAGGWVTANQTLPSPNTYAVEALPPAIKRAALTAAVFLFLNDGSDLSLTSERLQSYGFTRAAKLGDSGLPELVEQMLNAYRIVAMA